LPTSPWMHHSFDHTDVLKHSVLSFGRGILEGLLFPQDGDLAITAGAVFMIDVVGRCSKLG